MRIKTILINFVDIEPYYLNISNQNIGAETTNESTSPICKQCDKECCLMSHNIKQLVIFFNNLRSYSQGRITMFNVNNSELIIQGDAQKLFIYSILALITNVAYLVTYQNIYSIIIFQLIMKTSIRYCTLCYHQIL